MSETQPQKFTHRPRAAVVPKERQHREQRYFNGTSDHGLPHAATGQSISSWSGANTRIWRLARHDSAKLDVSVTTPHGDSTTTIHLTAAELRDLAQRLLDAAHDIEAHPAAHLRAEQQEEVAG